MTSQNLTEFYEERQGRPASKVAVDMESHRPPVVTGSAISLGYLSSVILTYEDTVVVRDGDILYRS